LISAGFLGEARSSPIAWVAAAVAPALLGTLLIGLIIGEWWHLAGYVWYFLPGTALSQEPAVIYAGTIYHPVLVVVIFCLATVTASLIDYYTVRKVLQLRRFAPLKQTSFYQAAVRCFYWQPWWTIVVFAFTPLPFFPVRVLALSSNYPLLHYVSANVVGRAPRYYLLAVAGAWLTIPLMYMILMGFIMALIPTLFGFFWSRRSAAQALATAA
jgi:membrane protein YqaA with SNARE-associated domain